MAEHDDLAMSLPVATPERPATLDEARALARERFKARLSAGEQVGDCACHDEHDLLGPTSDQTPADVVVGVRFRDSGQTYYFAAAGHELAVGDWVVVETNRGREAGRVVLAPQAVRRSLLQGAPTPVHRKLSAEDIAVMEEFRRGSAKAVRALGARSRAIGLPIKPISAEYNFDGTQVTLNYSASERDRHPDPGALRRLARDLGAELDAKVELKQVGPRDEARLLGGLGRCGRTLCCSSWLPVFPEISMNMAKMQDLPLNPAKVSGVCGRLLCCLSYENEQYKQMKAIMPRLGQPIDTPAGPAVVVALQLLRELVTVRLEADGTEAVFSTVDLGLRSAPPVEAMPTERPRPTAALADVEVEVAELVVVAEAEPEDGPEDEPEAEGTAPSSGGRRRRRRRGSRRGGQPSQS